MLRNASSVGCLGVLAADILQNPWVKSSSAKLFSRDSVGIIENKRQRKVTQRLGTSSNHYALGFGSS
jgi:hypothetical protein